MTAIAWNGNGESVRTEAPSAPEAPPEVVQIAPTATPMPPFPEPTAVPEPTPTPEPTPVNVAQLPIIDLHFHPDYAWGNRIDVMFDQVGVRKGGSGASDSDAVAIAIAEQFPGRIAPFGGGPMVRQLVLVHGAAAWNLEAAAVQTYLQELEANIAAGKLRGIGEIHVNNWASNVSGRAQYRFPADSPLIKALFNMGARHGVPLSIHMDAEAQSVAEMERLLASNRDATLIWAHTGHYADPDMVRRLLAAHPNLVCELSYRTSSSSSRTAVPMDVGGTLREPWRLLLNEYSDRFVIGTDLFRPDPGVYAAHIRLWRLILDQLQPEAAVNIAYRNAESLLNPGPVATTKDP